MRSCVFEIFGDHDQTGSFGYARPSVVYITAAHDQATITLPMGLGQTLGIKCTINGGKDASNSRNDPNAIYRLSVAVLTSLSRRLGFSGETDEWGGTLPLLNGAIIDASGGAGGGNLLYAGTQSAAANATVSFVNSNGVTFGMSANAITASFSGGGGGGPNYTFSNSNGISFGTNASVVTASYTVPTVPTQTAFVLSNGNNVTFGTNGSTVTASVPTQTSVNFSNSNGISFGLNASTLTASYTVPSTAGLLSAIKLSAGTASANLSAVTFSNSNGMSFGLNGSTITGSYTVPTLTSLNYSNSNNVSFGINGSTLTASASFAQTAFQLSNSNGISFGTNGSTVTASYTVPTQTAFVFSNSNGVTFGTNASTVTASVAAQSVQTQSNVQGISAAGGVARTGDVVFSNSNGISFGMNGNTITATVNPGAAAGLAAAQAGTQTATSGTIVFANSNGLTFGMSGSSQITGSYTVPTQTAFQLSNSNGISFGTNGSTVTASYTVPSTAGLISGVNLSAGTTSNNLTAFTLSNSNGLSFGLNGSVITGSYTVPNVPAQTNQTVGLYGLGNTTQNSSTTLDARSLSFNGLGAVAVGYSNGSIQVSAPTQTAFVLSNSNGISFGTNGSTVTASYTVPSTAGLISGINLSAGTTSNNLTAFTLSNSNGLAFGLNGSVITGSYTVPTVPSQTNQTIGLYALGNTTQNSSTTLDARTLSFNGLGAATVGYSNGSIQVSVPVQTAQTQSNVAGFYDGANSISTGTVRLSNANGVSFGIAGQTVTASVAAQTNQTIGFFGVSNTTQGSSGTLDARSLSFQGAGIASVGYSNGSVVVSVPSGGGGLTNVNLSAGTTSNNLSAFVFSNSNSVSFGLSGSTVTASIPSQTFVFSNSNNVSFGLNGSTITASASFAGGGGGVANQAGTQTATSGTVVFSNSNGITFGMSNSSVITASFNGTLNSVVFSNANGIVFGSAGNTTITASYNPATASVYSLPIHGAVTNTQQTNGSLSFRYLSLDHYVSMTRLDVPMIVSITNSAAANTGNIVFTSGAAIYTANGSTLAPIVGVTGSTTYTWASTTSNHANIIGVRPASFALATLLSPGEYWIGVQISTTNNSSIGTATTQLANSISMLAGSQYTALNYAEFGATANSIGFVRMQGVCGTTMSNTTQTFQQSQITAAGVTGMRGNIQMIFRNI